MGSAVARIINWQHKDYSGIVTGVGSSNQRTLSELDFGFNAVVKACMSSRMGLNEGGGGLNLKRELNQGIETGPSSLLNGKVVYSES